MMALMELSGTGPSATELPGAELSGTGSFATELPGGGTLRDEAFCNGVP